MQTTLTSSSFIGAAVSLSIYRLPSWVWRRFGRVVWCFSWMSCYIIDKISFLCFSRFRISRDASASCRQPSQVQILLVLLLVYPSTNLLHNFFLCRLLCVLACRQLLWFLMCNNPSCITFAVFLLITTLFFYLSRPYFRGFEKSSHD